MHSYSCIILRHINIFLIYKQPSCIILELKTMLYKHRTVEVKWAKLSVNSPQAFWHLPVLWIPLHVCSQAADSLYV